MPADFIKIARDQSAATEAGELLSWVRSVRQVLEVGDRIKSKMQHNFDDSDPQNILWGDLETLWGVPAGEGQAVFNYVNGTVGSLKGEFQTADGKNLTERVG